MSTACARKGQVGEGAAEIIINCISQTRPKGGTATKFSGYHAIAAVEELSNRTQMTTEIFKSTYTLPKKWRMWNATALCRHLQRHSPGTSGSTSRLMTTGRYLVRVVILNLWII